MNPVTCRKQGSRQGLTPNCRQQTGSWGFLRLHLCTTTRPRCDMPPHNKTLPTFWELFWIALFSDYLHRDFFFRQWGESRQCLGFCQNICGFGTKAKETAEKERYFLTAINAAPVMGYPSTFIYVSCDWSIWYHLIFNCPHSSASPRLPWQLPFYALCKGSALMLCNY